MEFYLFLAGLFLLAYLSIRLRGVNRRTLSEGFGTEPKDSPLSKGLVELISAAGGIYISLTLAISFLKIDYAPMYEFLSVEFDFLAAISIVLAIVQPVVIFILNKLKVR